MIHSKHNILKFIEILILNIFIFCLFIFSPERTQHLLLCVLACLLACLLAYLSASHFQNVLVRLERFGRQISLE